MGRVTDFIDDFSFWSAQLVFFRGLSQQHPGLILCHDAIAGLKRIIREEQKRYRKLFGEGFSMNNVDARILADWIRQSGYQPNAWEEGFLTNVYNQGYQLTSKQRESLQMIYAKSSSGGAYQNRRKI